MARYFYAINLITIYTRKICDRFRSRRFMVLLLISLFITTYFLFKLSPKSKRTGYYTVELESCMQKNLEKYSNDIRLQNTVVTDGHDFKLNYLEHTPQLNPGNIDANLNHIEHTEDDEHFFLPYTGNGYIGISIQTSQGIYVNFQKALSLNLHFNPLVQVYSDTLAKSESSVTEFKSGIVHLYQCYQSNKDCFSIQNTLYAHRTRPSLLIEELLLNNPSKESVTFQILQMGDKNWNHTKTSVKTINGEEFSIISGVIDVSIDHKLKHLCVSIGTTRLPIEILLNGHEFFKKYTVLTAIKYSAAFLSGKLENLDPILSELESDVVREIQDAMNVGYNKLRQEHVSAWETIWSSGFGISNSLATGAMNGNQLNGTIYYLLTNSRAPHLEVTKLGTGTNSSAVKTVSQHFNMERCYEGFSTMHAVKLWKLPRNEKELSDSNLLWQLTLQKHGCGSLLELGTSGILQAIILSLGNLKFTRHHLDLNLNPRQLHRDYKFRRVNYEGSSMISIDVEVGYDNHAVLYVTLNELIDEGKKFYACDAGCIDPPVELILNDRIQFPVKLTSPITAILYISADKKHINELKHALHVQEVDIAPAQDVNSIAIHKHGHHMAGFATLFWTIFVFLIIIFHLFLIKLVYRELCASQTPDNNSNSQHNKKYRYTRTV